MAFDGIPKFVGTNLQQWAWQSTYVVNGIMQGKTNNTGTITLTASQATTTVTVPDGALGDGTVVLFSPTTANAATEFGAGSLYVSGTDVLNSQFTITHVNNSQTDRIFDYVLVG